MNRTDRQTDSRRPINSMSGLVIAAIGFQLLLCSATTAAHACSGSIDRSARRIPSSVAQAFREIVDRHTTDIQTAQVFEHGYRINDCDVVVSSTGWVDSISPTDRVSGFWLLNLPPPIVG